MPVLMSQITKKKNTFVKRINVLSDRNYFFNIVETDLMPFSQICVFQFTVPSSITQMVCVESGVSNGTLEIFNETYGDICFKLTNVKTTEMNLILQKSIEFSCFLKNEENFSIQASAFINILIKR